jgi:predicted membrane-bound mannosyltransferase
MARDDSVDVGIALLLIVVLVGQMAGAGLWTVYLAPQEEENKVVQYAQPGGDIKPVVQEMQAASAGNQGTDVLVYGEFYVDGDANATRTPACVKWFNALPLPWYFAAHDSAVECAQTPTELRQQAGAQPPIVITRDQAGGDEQRNPADVVREQFPEYEERTYELRTYGTETAFFVHPDYARTEDET